MIRIAICDDEASQAREIARIVGNFFQKQEIAHRIDLFSSGEALLKDQEFIDVVFLDIQMGGIDGIETAQELRNRDTRTVLFFITSYSQHIMRSMTIHPFAFLVKPVEEEQLVQNLEDYLNYARSMQHEEQEGEIYLMEGEMLTRFDPNEIYYFHYLKDRVIEVVTEKKRHQVKNTITQLYDMLNHNLFLMPSQSFLVNIQYIQSVNTKAKSLIMKNGDVILVARRRYPEIFEFLSHSYFK